jgi:uncharacterized protein GlcG (DUF336 family)
VDAATGRAWAAVGMGVSSRLLADRVKGNPNFFVSPATTAQRKFLRHTGRHSTTGARLRSRSQK